MSRLLVRPGTDDHGMLIDLAHRRGFIVHALGAGIYQVERRDGERCLKGSAAEVHRFLRSRPA
jgi:hypothetical protein